MKETHLVEVIWETDQSGADGCNRKARMQKRQANTLEFSHMFKIRSIHVPSYGHGNDSHTLGQWRAQNSTMDILWLRSDAETLSRLEPRSIK